MRSRARACSGVSRSQVHPGPGAARRLPPSCAPRGGGVERESETAEDEDAIRPSASPSFTARPFRCASVSR
jgi:hypothetical protein